MARGPWRPAGLARDLFCAIAGLEARARRRRERCFETSAPRRDRRYAPQTTSNRPLGSQLQGLAPANKDNLRDCNTQTSGRLAGASVAKGARERAREAGGLSALMRVRGGDFSEHSRKPCRPLRTTRTVSIWA